MLDIVHRYANCYVALPVIRACIARGILKRLLEPAADLTALARDVGANEGPLRVAYRLLFELGGNVEEALPQIEVDARMLPLLASLQATPESEFPAQVREMFCDLGWAEGSGDAWSLTEPGRYMLRSGAHIGTVLSYGPLFDRMDTLLFGDSQSVFARDAAGHERHVDRSLNVVASGAQHQTYFHDLEEAVVGYFRSLPVHERPRGIVDMGCGDGTLLRQLYDAIGEPSLRMIGVDFNQKALDEAARTLSGVPHLLLKGDIGNPEALLGALRAKGIEDREVLHVRSFLDHDRPSKPPIDMEAVRRRPTGLCTGVYIDSNGNSIAPAEVVQSLIEHLRRWRSAASRHGLTLLEVHNVRPEVVRADPHGSECLHFDAYHGFSGQQTVEAPVFLMAAAEAGLFPDGAILRRYPRTMDFTRITLNRFEARPYIARHPRMDDLPALLKLEAECFAPQLRAPESELLRRITAFPSGAVVVEHEGEIIAASYTQRIQSADKLCRYADVAELFDSAGPCVQLLGLIVAPAWQDQSLGGELLEFMRAYISLWDSVDTIVGVTRCREYNRQQAYEDYIASDPIVRFHLAHGAVIEGVLPEYRPEDVDNDGAGILIFYKVSGHPNVRQVKRRQPKRAGERAVHQIADIVRECILQVKPLSHGQKFLPTVPLMEAGFESLDLLELRKLLGDRLDRTLDPTFFFRYGTPKAITDHLSNVSMSSTSAITTAASSESGFAIVGMACRFPGGANSPDLFWDLLDRNVDAITEIPADRFAASEIAFPRQAGIVDGIDFFDADFFRISPREAQLMDPQQRMLLEVVWEALENGGINPASLQGSKSGVFVGAISREYESLLLRHGAAEDAGAYLSTGNASSMAAGRIAYFLDWHGPAITVDTACSSSLVAVHMACRALEHHECDLALAGGVNLILSAETSAAYSRAGMLSPDGRCHTFDAEANGYVRGEGCGTVAIKRLDDARREGNRILAIIRGSAINQDGAGAGLTAPNERAQEELLRDALTKAGVAACEVDYLEAHGTGTSLGDPIELNAAAAALSEGRSASQLLVVGSVKTNIGHLEAAAGIASLIKVVLAMQHGRIPQHLHFKRGNPHIDWEHLPLRVAEHAMDWPTNGKRAVAGISSFGFSGTNAHVVIEGGPTVQPSSDATGACILTLSARSESALGELAKRYRQWFAIHPEANPVDVCHTASVGRFRFSHTVSIPINSIDDAIRKLTAFEAGHLAIDLTASGLSQTSGRRISIPTYPFERKRHWFREPESQLFEIQWIKLTSHEPGIPASDIFFATDDNFQELLDLIRSNPESPRCIVTCGAYAVTEGEVVNPRQRMFWGIGRVLSFERPDHWLGMIDLPADADAALPALTFTGGEDQLAIRQDGIFAARLATMQAEASEFHPQSTWLITGGSGAVGQELVQWLASHGASDIVIASRNPRVDAHKGVHVFPCDCRRREDVASLIARIDRELPPLRGVIHAAGIYREERLNEQTAEDLQAVLAPKIDGAWNLHQATLDHSLDAFICVSSIASVWGGPGQGAYAAANAFLDGLVSYRCSLGLPALSVNFGPLEAGGMADAASRHAWAKSGIRAVGTAKAISGLAALLSSGRSEGVVADVDLDLFRAVYQFGGKRRLLAQLGPLSVENRVRKIAGALLGMPPASIDDSIGFRDLGMDSLMAIEFRKRLVDEFGSQFSVPSTIAFDYPNLTACTNYFNGQSATPLQPQPRLKGNEPIAIIGLACRFPGAPDADAFWRLLEEGRQAIGEVPRERWNINEFYDPEPGTPGCMYTRRGGFIKDVDRFDAALFGIAPREAASMDPQQRVLLETTWEALESAACAPLSLHGTRTGVFIGASANEYSKIATAAGFEEIDAWYGSGNALNALAGRVSFVLGLQGPAMVIDTACSSSLVALHQACQGLRAGECEMAIAGGVNLMLTPAMTIATCQARMLSAEGLCKTFDESADGYVRSEGCGVVLLKPLSTAERDGDRILAVVRGSAVNQDGASSSLTAPNGPSQQRVIADALAQTGLTGQQVDYLEAHGAGTALGDPIEVHAAAAVLAKDRDLSNPLLIGSVKTNIGHLEAASGVAGVIKVILAMEHGRIPSHLHLRSPNSHIPWNEFPVRVVTSQFEWPRRAERPIAGVSSFGFTGTNAHLVLEGPPRQTQRVSDVDDKPVLVLSAKTEMALPEMARRYFAWFEAHPDAHVADVCYTASTGRSRFPSTWFFEASSVEEVKRALRNGPGASVCADPKRIPSTGNKLSLPTYPFQRQRFWIESPEKPRPLLGNRVDLDTGETVWQTTFSCENQPFLRDHKLYETITTPGATWAALMMLANGTPVRLESVTFVEPLLLSGERDARDVQLLLSAADEARRRKFRVVSWPAGHMRASRVLHATGWITATSSEIQQTLPLENTKARLTPMPATELFTYFRTFGLDLGPSLQSVSKLWRGEREVLAEVVVPASLRGQAPIHPAVFDACTQTLGAIWGVSGESFYAPLEYGSVELHQSAPARFYCFARRTDMSDGETRTLDIDLVLPSGEQFGFIRDFNVKRAPREVFLRGLKPEIDSWFYSVEWEEQPAAVFAMSQLQKPEPPEHEFEAALERLAGHYAAKALGNLEREPCLPRYGRLVSRLRDAAVVDAAQPLKHYEGIEFELLNRCGIHLSDVLTGKVDPLGLLFPEHGMRAEQLYRDSPAMQAWNRLAARVVHDAIPSIGPVRILEIGAGTGGTTSSILPELPADRTQYVYSDLSPGFFDAAERRFAAYPFVEFRKLDTERDPVLQGFEPHTFDIVVAANVLHATRDLERSLANLRQFLAPSGLLVLLEGVTKQLWLDLTFGLLEGWWRFDDSIRTDYPLIDTDAWTNLLSRSGFSKSQAVSGRSGQALITARAEPLAATWLIESDDESAATLLTGHLEAANQRCVSTRLDLESPSGVIIMRGLDAETLSIAQALLEQNHRPERGLWFVTRNGQCINSDTAPVPEQSAMWGFAKVLALEHPEVPCHRVDIDEVGDLDSQMARVAAEVLESGTPSEDQVAYRSDHRFVPRLKRATLPGTASLKLKGTYLITGGTGGLGLATARWLSERGVSRIVLTSRTGDSTDPIIDEIRSRGTHVDIVLGDISREEDVLRVLSQSGSLTGVIHAAGVLHDGAIVNQAWSTFQTVLDPKIRGAILLHRHTAGMPLQHFILFSSSSGLLGNRGQANHAAANMFLDQLARYRTSRGLPAVSIDWGPWSQTGAAARRGQVGTPGMNWIAPEQGLEALERILAANVAQVGVISVDWRAFAAQFANSQTSSFFNGMIPAVEGKSGSKREVPDTRVAELLESVTPSERRPLLTEYLAQQVMRVLRLDSRPAPDIGFFDIGMDSLMAVELRNRISSDLGLPRALPSTTLFDYPTVAALAAHLSPEPTAIGAPRNSDDVLGHLLEDVDDAGLDRFSQSDFDSLIESAYRTLGE